MTQEALPTFRPLEDFDVAALTHSGYAPRWLSVFDHWLSLDEAAASPLMSFDIAMKHGAGETYLEQERCFLRFYQGILDAGSLRLLPNGVVEAHDTFDQALADALIRSLREQELIDLYLPALKLRIVGGYDRTDLLLFERPEFIPHVKVLASGHGLFVLDSTN